MPLCVVAVPDVSNNGQVYTFPPRPKTARPINRCQSPQNLRECLTSNMWSQIYCRWNAWTPFRVNWSSVVEVDFNSLSWPSSFWPAPLFNKEKKNLTHSIRTKAVLNLLQRSKSNLAFSALLSLLVQGGFPNLVQPIRVSSQHSVLTFISSKTHH